MNVHVQTPPRSPIRAELYSADRLVELARELAGSHEKLRKPPRLDLLAAIQQDSASLQKGYEKLTQALSQGKHLQPAEEWLVDNFHFISAQLRGIRTDLPKKYYQQLPALASGPMQGYPRVYEMAMRLIAHTDSHLDAETIRHYIDSYQQIRLLTTGELWAIAIMLRIALLQNLARIIEHAERDRVETERAEIFVSTLHEVASRTTEDLQSWLEMQPKDLKNFSHSFIAHLVLRLREEGSSLTPAMDWLLHLASAPESDLDEMIRQRNQELATSRVSVSNVILSLRLLASIDWTDVVEATSAIESSLREDPARYYTRCDFATRDLYRHAIEEMTRRSSASESEIATALLRLAREAQEKDPENVRTSHVGYYLVGQGRPLLEKAIGFRPGPALLLRRIVKSHPTLHYLGTYVLLTAFLETLLYMYVRGYTSSFAAIALSLLLALAPSTALSLLVVNWLVSLFFRPEILPKLDLKDGITSELRTIVVLPTMLTDLDEVAEIISRLEVHYLANPDDNLDFAVLSDYTDAETPTSPNDEKLLQAAQDGIAQLNRRYPRPAMSRFHLYHRARKWNEGEGKWMGWERKRGKLEEFNRLLLGDTLTTYLPAKVPESIQFVITVDFDSILPRDSARKLIGALAHPNHRPVVDPVTKHVVEGYGILQPRVSHTLTSANRTWFAKIFSGPTGIDPYTRAVSDLYQDLFQEASFIGKGIYDLKAFYQCLDRRFPENSLLSHDLIEGGFARTALVSDVEIFDDYPSNYLSSVLRNHRWARGDWQLLPWLFPVVPSGSGKLAPNSLSRLNRWKLFDNLRRSLVSPALFLLILAGWTVLPGSVVFWMLFSLSLLFAPTVIGFLTGIFSMTRTMSWLDQLRAITREAGSSAMQGLVQTCFLAVDAVAMTDAIVRALFRMARRRKLLEWVTASQAEHLSRHKTGKYLLQMSGSLLLALVALFIVWITRAHSMTIALPFVGAWLAAPLIGQIIGMEVRHRRKPLSSSAVSILRSHALEIWYYFSTLVTEDDHWLPPDNIQETPQEQVAHRTSPTNIGFALLANIAAYDFGYVGLTECIERIEKTVSTLSRMSTFNGHFYNWYDTRTLIPLEPRYVSTVDSGNLSAALLVVRQFLQNEIQLPSGPHGFAGIVDHAQKLLTTAERSGISLEKQKIIREMIRFALKAEETKIAAEELLQWMERVLPEVMPEPYERQEVFYWWEACCRAVASYLADYSRPQDLRHRLASLGFELEQLVRDMDFRFLFDEDRGLFSIGFNVTWGRLDNSYYDLLASESRIASLVAIAKGDVPQSHWFRMSRSMLSARNHRVLASWSGSMFEYLMPLLFTQNEPNTLFDETYRNVVKVQKQYGKERKIPWGISEAAFNTRDVSHNYQYGPFGVPSLGLKQGLNRDLVVAPYATFLAAMLDPNAAVKNLAALEQYCTRGRFGLYESIDFTPERLEEGKRFETIRAYMVHHMGMSLIALDNVLHEGIIQRRFHSDASIKATSVLLQERTPLVVRLGAAQLVDERPQLFRLPEPAVAREFLSPHLTPPPAQVLSNGTYFTVLTSAGSGYSQWRGLRINRWQEDGTRDHWGSWIYLKDAATGAFWSAGFQPTQVQSDHYRVKFAEDRCEYRRRDGVLETHMDVTVSPEEDAEVRRITLVNMGPSPVEIEVTSYQEVVIAPASTDLAHQAFSGLFVETEFVTDPPLLLASRRKRAPGEEPCWAAHLFASEGATTTALEYETDRVRFIGRGKTARNPIAMQDYKLSRTTGAVLDPIFSLRARVRIEPYSREVVAFTTVTAATREEVLALAVKYTDGRNISRAFELASSHAQVTFHQLSLSQEDADLFQRILGRLIYLDLSMRPRPAVLARNTRTQSALWAYGISGDLPICLVRIEDPTELDIVKQLLHAHEYWRSKGFVSDLVILNEYPSSYFQELQDEIQSLIRSTSENALLNKPGGVFLLVADQLPEEDRTLLRTAARVKIIAQRGSLATQVARVERKDPLPPPHRPTGLYPVEDPDVVIPPPERIFGNGFGGFSPDGREYRIGWTAEQQTPAPWINVISNRSFGFLVSERGVGMTWSQNSHENRITPWSNDAVSDPVSEAIYIRDEESGNFWSATPSPVPGNQEYWVSHGPGYTRFLHGAPGIEQELTLFVSPDEPIRFMKLHLRNRTRRTRKLSVTYYADLVLGVNRNQSAPFITTSIDKDTGALFAVNRYNNEFAGRVTFLTINDKHRTLSADRSLFLGVGGSMENPEAMRRAYLSGSVGAGLDPCAAVQGNVVLGPLSDHTMIILLGESSDIGEARTFIRRYSDPAAVEKVWERSQKEWESILSSVQIQTPDQSMNLLFNRWLLYQTYSCRFWARSAFYQSSGAFGFRDQLQDALAFSYSRPDVLREHILCAAAHQFEEGDVQHWWHPPSGRGVRTKIADDLLWMPYCVAQYLKFTSDRDILDEEIPFLVSKPLEGDETDLYFQPKVSEEHGSIFEHCVRAIDRSLEVGKHGLPLFGSGDWNDGMNRLGVRGLGESVWLGWFLLTVLNDFGPICKQHGDETRATHYREVADYLKKAIDLIAWDGEWYLRGYDDDGDPIGSSRNEECRIDSIVQSWAVLSQAGDPEKIKKALHAVEEHLFLPEEQLLKLFDPPFAHRAKDPGYIMSYPAGIRENGGQYNHAVMWMIAAYCASGDGDKAYRLFNVVNPVLRSSTKDRAEKYRLEPYVVAADIYSSPQHMAQGGWSWYTGSAAWLYRVCAEHILGLRLKGDHFTMEPCVPKHWPGFTITYNFKSTVFVIQVENVYQKGAGVKSVHLDGELQAENRIPLVDDGKTHAVRVILG